MEKEDVNLLNDNIILQLTTKRVVDYTKTELNREHYYIRSNWDSASLFNDWINDNWHSINAEVFDLLKLYRILDQIMFLLNMKTEIRSLYTNQVLQHSATVIISIFTIQLQNKLFVEELERLYEDVATISKSDLTWDGECLFSDLLSKNWHKAEEKVFSTLKLCRLLDKVMFAAGINFEARNFLVNSKKITATGEVRGLMKIQLLTLEKHIVQLKLELQNQLNFTETKNNENESICIIQ